MKPSVKTETARIGLIVGLALLHFACGLHVAGWIALVCGATPNGVLVLPALAAAIATGAWLGGRRGAVWATAGVLTIVGAALLGAAAVYDLSWDGQVYHQEAVLALRGGWNPLHDGPLSLDRPDNLWINHYPKGVWIAEAVLVAATSSLEAAKGIGLIVLIGAGALAHELMRARGARPLVAWTAAIVLAGNPVALAQLGSFYLDGVTVGLLLAFLCLALHPRLRAEPAGMIGQAASLGFLLNTKFTSVIYVAILLLGLAAAFRQDLHDRKRRWGTHAAALLVGVFALGFDPYVTNTIRHGHPFHPIMGAHPVDFLSIQLTPGFNQRPRLVRLLIATFARASNHNDEPRITLPALSDPDQDASLAQADVRIGGFGPLWGGICVIGFALALVAIARASRSRAWLLGATIAASALLNPACWWARYVPQLWLMPAGLGAWLLLDRGPASARLNRLGLLLLLLCGFDAALVARAAWTGQWQGSLQARQQLERLARAGAPVAVRWNGFEANRARLDQHAITHTPTQGRPAQSSERMIGSQAELFVMPARTLAAGKPVAP
jgi:hypothetical protein